MDLFFDFPCSKGLFRGFFAQVLFCRIFPPELVVLQGFDALKIRQDIGPRHGELEISWDDFGVFGKIDRLLGSEFPPSPFRQWGLRVHS